MRKRLFLILSVTIMLAAGCGSKDNVVPDMETEATETVIDTEEPDMAEDKEVPAADQAENGDTEKEQTEKETAKETEQEERNKEAEETPEPKSASQPGQKEETEPAQGSTDVPKQEEPKQEETKPEKTKPEETKQQEQTVTAVSYDPVSVCSQAVAKCQAGGMITTTDNLASLLAEGRITQEEYNSYYPYDGLGYYSVFVETDLNEASTTSGRKLGSVDGITDYIAGMMLLETEPVFYIEYAGVYNLNGTDFYEFRCYR
jgi:outer membrane biosynthesis protein TonB